jgi:four helix bundle protein
MRSVVEEKSIAFAHRIIDCTDYIMANYKKYSLCDQLFRSGTSIGANIAEAQYAQSPADFISKLSISQKECSETSYWLELAYYGKYIDEKMYNLMMADNTEIMKLLTSIITTSKKNNSGK